MLYTLLDQLNVLEIVVWMYILAAVKLCTFTGKVV